jgi:hypothetical protein
LRREWKLFYKYALRNRGSADLRAALVSLVVVEVVATLSPAVRSQSHVLDVAAGLFIAILAVVITALSILVVFVSREYGVLLTATFDGDVGEVFYPYRLIAAVSAVGVIVTVAGIFAWPVAGDYGRVLFLSFALALLAWGIFGVFDLVRITADHAKMKMRVHDLSHDELKRLTESLSERIKLSDA